MRVAPNAKPDDGVFDVIIMGGAPKSRAIADMKLIYTGEHLNNPGVRAMRGAKVDGRARGRNAAAGLF